MVPCASNYGTVFLTEISITALQGVLLPIAMLVYTDTAFSQLSMSPAATFADPCKT